MSLYVWSPLGTCICMYAGGKFLELYTMYVRMQEGNPLESMGTYVKGTPTYSSVYISTCMWKGDPLESSLLLDGKLRHGSILCCQSPLATRPPPLTRPLPPLLPRLPLQGHAYRVHRAIEGHSSGGSSQRLVLRVLPPAACHLHTGQEVSAVMTPTPLLGVPLAVFFFPRMFSSLRIYLGTEMQNGDGSKIPTR